ncbi:MAG: peptidyl-prolyl cis-trans isomerase [Candidatus Aminicenantales bacterium]|jgi:peptidyl-prolyl cis-trans isomerase D
MLKTMRKNVKSLKWVMWIVVATFIVSIFVIWGGSGQLSRGLTSGALVQMSGSKVTVDMYTTGLRNRVESLRREMKDINRNLIEQLSLPQQVLEQLVEQQLIFGLAKDLGITASDAEVKDRIVNLPGLQRDGQFIGYEEYRRVLGYNHISVSQFEEEMSQEIVLTKTIQALTAGVVVTPDEVWDAYRKSKDSAKIEYLALEKSKITLDKEPDEAEVKAWFDGHKDNYKMPERREGLYAFLKNDDLKKEIELGEAEIGKYYADNKAQFENPEKVKVSRIFLPFAGKDKAKVTADAQTALGRALGGEDFAVLAKGVSKDEKAKDGGDWGLFDWKSLPPKEQDAIAKLDSGKISGLVESDLGVAFLKVTEKDPASVTPLDAAKPRIRTMLQDQKARALAEERITKLAQAAGKAKSLEAAAKAANIRTDSTGLLKDGQALGEIDPSGSIAAALFRLKDKDISAAVPTYGGYGLVEMRKTEAPRPAAYGEVKADVKNDVTEAKKKDLAAARIKEVRAKLTDKNWEDMAQKYKLEYKTVDDHKKEQYLGVIGESAEVDNLAFSLPLKQLSEPIDYATGIALLRVLDRKEAARSDFDKEKDTQTKTILEQKKNLYLQAYLAKLRADKNVKVRYDLFQQTTQDVLNKYDTNK